MLVSWTAPVVPNTADINRFVVRYHPIDSDDDTTERSVSAAFNSLILRGKRTSVPLPSKTGRDRFVFY